MFSTDAPAPPTVTASPLSERGKISVSWTPPTAPTGSTITGYSIQYRRRGSGSYTTVSDPGSSSTSTTLSGLEVGTEYEVRVGAKTEVGVGPSQYRNGFVTTFGSMLQNYCPLIYL